ncbi:MAG: hypothetical protein M0010_11055 [Actinomycetota bacterium]|nr:hypothetical protein [Actinomycetota bacterium]
MLAAVGQQLALSGVVLVVGGHLGGDRFSKALGPVVWHFDARVEVLDFGFELVGGDVALLAARAVAAVFLPETVEVRVRALRVLDRKPPPAHPAHEDALQVVMVPALARPSYGPGSQQLLDLVEGGTIDERLVAALVLDAVPIDDADVGPMPEQTGETRDGECLGRVVPIPAPVAKPAMGHLLGQALDRPFAGGVQLEGRPDQRGAFGIGDDVGNLATADGLADVQVTQGRLVRVATELGLLAHALSDLVRQVGRVELGHEGVDALDQPSRGGLVEVLGHRHERNAAPAQECPNGDMILHVPCQPVDLVDDDRLDVALLADPRQHRSQLRPVGRPRRLALADVLVEELPALVADAPDARFALGGDGEAVLGEVLLGLFLGRDPQVDHTAHRPPPLLIGP